MCGRTRVSLAPDQVLRAAGTARWVNREAYQPSYNVSPGSATPVVVAGADGLQVQTMRWGLVPSFTKKDERPDFWRMFNARSESVAEKPAFRRLVPSRRCLVLVDAFYEWQKQKDGTKQPYHIYLASPKSEAAGSSGGGSQDQHSQQQQQEQGQGEQAAEEPMVFAGLWDVWDGPEGPMHTYTILTTDASKRLEWLHDRMPVILRTKEAQQAWLSTGDKAATGLQKLFTPYNGEDLRWYPVTPQMNKPAFQGAECCKEVKQPSIQSFFQPRRTSGAGSKAAGPPSPAAAAAAAAAGGAAAAGDAGGAPAVKQEHADAGMPAAAAVKTEGADATPAGPLKQEEEQQQQSQAAEPAGPAAAAVNADEQPAAKPSPQQQQPPAVAAGASPAGQKRKQPGGGSSGGGGSGTKGKGSGSAAKKLKPGEKLPGQKDVRQFFMKH